MIIGYNYPWAFNKYGLYFGPHAGEPWMDRWLDFYAQNLLEARDLGFEVVRIFLLCNGQNYGELPSGSAPGEPSFRPPIPADPAFARDLVRMLEITRDSNTGIRLIPSLVDFYFFGPIRGNSGGRSCVAKDPAVREAFFQSALDPLLRASAPYKEQIFAWEVTNEPYWASHYVSPPMHGSLMPKRPFVSMSSMNELLTGALDRIERAGFESTVGHRFFRDLSRWPGGTRPQFHYYAKSFLWLADPRKIPEHAETGGAFIGEIDSGGRFGKPWPELRGLDLDPARRAYERLRLVERKGYPLALLWPECEWCGPDTSGGAEFNAKLSDGLRLDPPTKDAIRRYVNERGPAQAKVKTPTPTPQRPPGSS